MRALMLLIYITLLGACESEPQLVKTGMYTYYVEHNKRTHLSCNKIEMDDKNIYIIDISDNFYRNNPLYYNFDTLRLEIDEHDIEFGKQYVKITSRDSVSFKFYNYVEI